MTVCGLVRLRCFSWGGGAMRNPDSDLSPCCSATTRSLWPSYTRRGARPPQSILSIPSCPQLVSPDHTMLVLLYSLRVRHEPFCLLHAGKLQLTLEKQFSCPEQSSIIRNLLLNYCLITDSEFNHETIIPPLLFCRSPGDGPEPHAASSQVPWEM